MLSSLRSRMIRTWVPTGRSCRSTLPAFFPLHSPFPAGASICTRRIRSPSSRSRVSPSITRATRSSVGCVVVASVVSSSADSVVLAAWVGVVRDDLSALQAATRRASALTVITPGAFDTWHEPSWLGAGVQRRDGVLTFFLIDLWGGCQGASGQDARAGPSRAQLDTPTGHALWAACGTRMALAVRLQRSLHS